jgi:hypothetical protein
MQSNIRSKSYSQETAPERSSSFRGEPNVIYIDGSPYKEEVAQLQMNYRAASSFPVGSNIRGAVMATSDELAEAKISASEARTDTRIARLEGKIDAFAAILGGKLDTLTSQVAEHRKDRNLIIGTIVVAAVTLGALFVALATYGDAIFGRGMSVRDVVQTVVKEQNELQRQEQQRRESPTQQSPVQPKR